MTEKNDSCYFYHKGTNQHAVIFIHGLNGSEKELGSLPQELAKLDFTVVIPKIKGFSNSTETTPFMVWIDQIKSIIRDLQVQGFHVSIVGFSMGATLALAVSVRSREIQNLCLLSPVLEFDGWAIPWYYKLLVIPYYLGLRSWTYHESEPFGLKNISLRKRVIESMSSAESGFAGANSFTARSLYASLQLISFVRKYIGQVSVNFQIIQSVDDESVSPKTAEFILEKSKSDVRKIIWLGDSYHVITMDNEKEIVTNEVIYFLKEGLHQQIITNQLLENRFVKAVKDRTN